MITMYLILTGLLVILQSEVAAQHWKESLEAVLLSLIFLRTREPRHVLLV